ncbi:hypothetical protein K1719_041185 [Acacia pycnantha]|nr:hypothetical protein K1719_041185 [Acacia pycnantha]
MDPTCGLADKIRDLVLDLIWKQLLYLVHYHRNIEQLKGQLDDLNHERSALQHRIDEAKNNVEQIEEKVLHWLGEVDDLSEKVQKFHEEESQAKTECTITSCPNPWLRYKLSKRAETIAQEVVKIYGKKNFDRVSYRVPPQSMPQSTKRESSQGIVSRVEIKNHIMEALRNPRFNMIGLCGLGGVGKTIIARDIEKEEKNQKVFEKVIMATVSQEMNIGHIQDQIIDKLGMQLNERTEEVKASRLYGRLENEKNMLLILDDLWQDLDLGKVGIPFVDVERYSKINEAHHEDAFPVLERLELNNMKALENLCEGPNAIVFGQLHTLKMENLPALTGDFSIKDRATKNASNKIFKSLFNKVLLPKLEMLEISSLNSLISLIWDDQLLHDSFNNLKTLTVEKCGFVKLVPLHVLKSLNNLEEVEVSNCDMLEIVFDFEDLNDYYKEMDSSLVVVPLKKLELWNLPKLKNVWSDRYQGNISFPSLRSVVVYNCESLTSIFPASIAKGMLCDLEELQISYCSVDVIVAKDQVSESVAFTFGFPRLTSLWISDLPNLRNFYPQKHTLEWPHLNQLSIKHCDELEIFEKEVSGSSEICEEENMLDSKYPLLPHDKVIGNLETLTLQGKQVEKIGSGQFLMYNFPKLKRLHLSLEKKPSFPFLGMSPNLRELRLSGDFEKALGGDNVASLTAHFPQLTLENISIMGSLSPSLVSSPNLTHLNVGWCDGTTLMTSSIARSLVHLTHLSISHCNQMEEIITKQEGEDDGDKEIFFRKLEFLKLDYLSRLRRFCHHNYTFRFPLLEHVTIIECPHLTMFCPGAIHAPQLESVRVHQFNPHKDIWMTDLNNTIEHLFTFEEVISTCSSMALNSKNITMRTDVFPKVSNLYVESFTDEGVTFPYSSLEKFPRLKGLYVEHCSFEEIFPSQDQITDFMSRLYLNGLYIAYMDKLKSIWKDDSQLPPIHQNLNVLKVESCCSLVQLAPSSASFQNLEELYVSGCHQLIHLVTTSTAKSLVSLETLEINDCKRMEEIVMNDTNEDVQVGIRFNRLYSIKLTDMPSLKMFSSQSRTFEFPIFEEIDISGCPEMKKFCPGVLKTPKLSKVKIEDHDKEWKDEEDVNKIIEGISSAKDSINI